MKMQKKLLLPELLHLAQICTKWFVGWGFAPDPTGGAYSAAPDPIAGSEVGPQGEAEGGREGGIWGKGEGRWGREVRESRNAQMQSWQA